VLGHLSNLVHFGFELNDVVTHLPLDLRIGQSMAAQCEPSDQETQLALDLRELAVGWLVEGLVIPFLPEVMVLRPGRVRIPATGGHVWWLQRLNGRLLWRAQST
jgi:hypothetical protein